MNKKKKKTTALVAAVIVLAALIVAFAVVQKLAKKYNDSQTESTDSLITLSADDITNVAYTVTGYDEISFTKSDDTWTYDQDPTQKINSGSVDNLVSSITGTTVTQKISKVSDLSQYGLDHPVYTVELKDKDGKTTKITIGTTNETTSTAYCTLNDDDTVVYAVSTGLTTDLAYSVDTFLDTSTSSTSSSSGTITVPTEG